MKTLLVVSAVVEAPTGLALLLTPSLPISLLLGSSLDTTIEANLARSMGAAVLSLALAYWWARNDGQSRAARGLVAAMLMYSTALTVLLASASVVSQVSGIALWPAVLLHVALAIWCIACLRVRPALKAG